MSTQVHKQDATKALNMWLNSVSFKEYFLEQDAKGESLVFELANFELYNRGAEQATETNSEFA